jgi:hypothetical protein
LDYRPFRIVELKNKNILVGSSDDDFLALYDSEFKLIRKITEIDGEIICPGGLAYDQNGNVLILPTDSMEAFTNKTANSN